MRKCILLNINHTAPSPVLLLTAMYILRVCVGLGLPGIMRYKVVASANTN